MKGAPGILAKVSQAGTSKADSRWGQRQLMNEVSSFLDELVKSGKMPNIDADPVNPAQFWLKLCEALWDPKQRAHIASKGFAKQDMEIMSHLAEVWLDLNPKQKVNVTGAIFSLKKQAHSYVWRQVMEWEGGGIKKNVLKYMTGYKREIINMDRVCRALAQTGKPKIDPHRAAAISIKNMREIELSPTCKPTGSFRVVIPEQIFLSQWGIPSLRVWVLPDQGMWVALEMDDRPQMSFKWVIRRPHLQRWILPERAIPTIHVVISALWRDLCVGGRRVMIEKNSERNECNNDPDPGKLKVFGEIQWGTDSDLKNIMREAHSVKWHLRELPGGKQASCRAKRVARKFGIKLPSGTTFVRSHRRGAPDRDTEGVPIHAKGLGRLILGERNSVEVNA